MSSEASIPSGSLGFLFLAQLDNLLDVDCEGFPVADTSIHRSLKGCQLFLLSVAEGEGGSALGEDVSSLGKGDLSILLILGFLFLDG